VRARACVRECVCVCHTVTLSEIVASSLAAEISSGVCGTPANSSGRQPNFVALNRGRHLHSAGRPSRWALVNILVQFGFSRIRNESFTGKASRKIFVVCTSLEVGGSLLVSTNGTHRHSTICVFVF